MILKNNQQKYGLIAVFLHWLIALSTFGLFGLGLWMIDLGYYDTWYQKGPILHEGIGAILFFLIIIRILWRHISPSPIADENHKKWEHISAKIAHIVLNVLLLAITVSGYLIVTAKGEALSVFGWFSLPATLSMGSKQADFSGDMHLWLAWSVIVLAAVHALGALKHHIIDKDRTLKRMFGR